MVLVKGGFTNALRCITSRVVFFFEKGVIMTASFSGSFYAHLPQAAYFHALYTQYTRTSAASALRRCDLKDPGISYFTDSTGERDVFMVPLPKRSECGDVGPRLVTVEMNAGIGSSLGIKEPNASKASGVKFLGPSGETSVLEAKLKWYAIHAHRFSSLAVLPWNNRQTSLSWNQLFLPERDLVACLERSGVKVFDPVLQAMFPRLKKDKAVPIDFGSEEKRVAPGGHGQVLFQLYQDGLLEKYRDEGCNILVLANTDGLNSTPDPYIANYMMTHNILGGMVTTDRTPIDAKGGIVVLRNGKLELIERAQVSDDQMPLFESIGLRQGDNTQPFNTNLIYLNISLLTEYLDALRNEHGEDAVLAALTPDLIVNQKKVSDGDTQREVLQLEGAIGSVVLRFPNVRLFHLPASQRAEGFTPIKTPPDVVYLYDSDAFTFNPETSQLEANVSGTFAAFHLSGWRGWNLLEQTRAAFGRPGMRDLRSLHVMGEVVFRDALFCGVVEVVNNTGRQFNFSEHPDAIREGGRLLFKNVRVIIDDTGVSYEALQT